MTTPYAIVTGDFVRTGGMDAPNFALASYIARSNHQVHLVAYRVADELRANRNIVVHDVPKPADSYALGAPLLATAGLMCAAAVVRRHGCVVVNGSGCPFPGVNWVHYVHAAFVPAVANRNWRSLKASRLHRLNVFTERVALRAARVVVANSERTRRDLIERVGIAAERVHTVYYGVDSRRFRPANSQERSEARLALGWKTERPRVAFIGALGDRRKGFDVVYDAWRTMCQDSSWDAELIVVGAGAELAAWRSRAAGDGLAERIAFLGFRQDVPRILAACDLLVAPTRYEAYGAGVHEALCSGLPAIVSAAAGVAERYPDSAKALLLEDPESAAALAASVRRWRDRTAGWRTEIASFSEQLRARTWDDMARDIVSLCESTR